MEEAAALQRCNGQEHKGHVMKKINVHQLNVHQYSGRLYIHRVCV